MSNFLHFTLQQAYLFYFLSIGHVDFTRVVVSIVVEYW